MNNLLLALILAGIYCVAANAPICNLDDRDRVELEQLLEDL